MAVPVAFIYPTTADYQPSKSGRLILLLIHGYFKKTGKPWAYLDQAWMLEKLEAWHGVIMARSTLNYNLGKLREHGFLETVKRHYRDKQTGHLIFRPTMYKPTKKLRSYFFKLAQYFKRCGWTPSLEALKAGYRAVVGAATTPEESWREYNRMRRRGAN